MFLFYDSVESHTREQGNMAAGFTARTSQNYKIISGPSKVCPFTDVLDNKGNHFEPSSGIFVAPVNGMYIYGLKHGRNLEIPARFDVVQELQSPGAGKESENVLDEAHFVPGRNCVNGSVWMNAGDKLFVRISETSQGDFTLLRQSTFHCYLIS